MDIPGASARNRLADCRAELLAAEERARKAEAERDAFERANRRDAESLAVWRERCEAAEAKLAEAREALEPLAESIEDWPLDGTSWLGVTAATFVDVTVRVSDIHRAAALLAETTEGGDGGE